MRPALAILVGLVLGCSSSSRSLPVEQYPVAYAKAVCASIVRCCSSTLTDPALKEWLGDPPSQASCETLVANQTVGLARQIADSASAGRVAYDPEATAACLDALAGADCAQFRWPRQHLIADLGCLAVSGQVRVGGGCLTSYECARGVCGRAGSMCFPGAPAGQPCFSGDDCDRGLECDNNTCIAPAMRPAGAACTVSTDCASRVCRYDRAHGLQCAALTSCGYAPSDRGDTP